MAGEMIEDFATRCDVVCPRCRSRAVVVASAPPRFDSPSARFTCVACARVEECARSRRPGDGSHVGGPVDPFFRYALWLQTPCVGEVLWAYNGEHLAFLAEYVSGGLRPHSAVTPPGRRNKLLESRLPKWMTTAKHRSRVVAAIDRLRVKL